MTFSWFVDSTFIDNGIDFTYPFDAIIGDSINCLVTLEAQTVHGCRGGYDTTITVHPDPIALIDTLGNLLDCDSLQIQGLIAANTTTSIANTFYQWRITDSNGNESLFDGITPPDYIIESDNDSIIVELIVSDLVNGCQTDIDSVIIRTIENPIADFTVSVDSACHNTAEAIIEVDTTSLSTEGLYTWIVTNEDDVVIYQQGPTFNLINPSFVLTNTSNTEDSTYTINLTVGDSDGCSHDTSLTVVIHPLPFADFVIDNSAVCPEATVSIDNESISNDSLSYIWSITPDASAFINDISFEDISITFTDNISGNTIDYALTLSLTTEHGCQNNTSENISVFTNPIAAFDILEESCGDTTISVINSSSFADSWLWQVSSNTITISDPTVESPTFGLPVNTSSEDSTYLITLTVTTSNGCDSIITDSIVIHPLPEVVFSTPLLDSCGVFEVNFINDSDPFNGQDPNSMTFSWFVDSTSIDNSIDFTYPFDAIIGDSINYLVTLEGQTIHGCRGDYDTTITVHPDPIALIDTLGNLLDCDSLQIQGLIAANTTTSIANTFYQWRITDSNGNESLFDGITPPDYIIESDNDSIIVELIVSDLVNGCQTDIDSVIIRTIENPIADFTVSVDSACHNTAEAIIEVDTTSLSTEGLYTWIVTNEDDIVIYQQGPTFNLVNPSFVLTNTSNTEDSTYTINLTVGDSNGLYT